ncbi:MAG: Dabb family protein [Thermoplasmatota archaeon]
MTATVTRVVHIRLGDDHKAEAADVAAAALRRFPHIPGVTSVWAGTPTDHDDADVLLLVGFARLDDVEPYRSHPLHVAFLNDELAPRGAAVSAKNYATPSASGTASS